MRRIILVLGIGLTACSPTDHNLVVDGSYRSPCCGNFVISGNVLTSENLRQVKYRLIRDNVGYALIPEVRVQVSRESRSLTTTNGRPRYLRIVESSPVVIGVQDASGQNEYRFYRR